jgi:putative SOS response-associated peptidase YedK
MLVRMGVQADFTFTARFNVAPTQEAPIVTCGADGLIALAPARWGLIPVWAKDSKGSAALINARADGLLTKQPFRTAYQRRRCLVLGDGFFEWKKMARCKQPVYFRMREGRPFAFGGLWEEWRDGERFVRSFCIITVEPNELCAPVHDRMPLILPESAFQEWLDPNASTESLGKWLKPAQADQMESWFVGERVNSPSVDSSDLIEPVRVMLQSELGL